MINIIIKLFRCLYIWILILSLQAAIAKAAHGRVGNQQFEQTQTSQPDVRILR